MKSNNRYSKEQMMKGVVLSWVQLAAALTALIVSLLTPLLVFVNQTSIRIALIEQENGQQAFSIKQQSDDSKALRQSIDTISSALIRLESRNMSR